MNHTMRVRLLKRLGQHQERSVVDYPDSEAQWLIERGCAVEVTGQPIEHVEAPSPEGQDSTNPAAQPDVTPDASDDTVEGEGTEESLKDLQARAEALGLKTYGSKQQVADRIAKHEAKKP